MRRGVPASRTPCRQGPGLCRVWRGSTRTQARPRQSPDHRPCEIVSTTESDRLGKFREESGKPRRDLPLRKRPLSAASTSPLNAASTPSLRHRLKAARRCSNQAAPTAGTKYEGTCTECFEDFSRQVGGPFRRQTCKALRTYEPPRDQRTPSRSPRASGAVPSIQTRSPTGSTCDPVAPGRSPTRRERGARHTNALAAREAFAGAARASEPQPRV